jgi:Kef-type K+ transport system membrane component KefB
VDEVLDHHRERHLEHLIEPVGHFVVPIFFVLAGMQVKLDVLANPKILALAAVLTLVAIAGKLVSGIAAGSVNRWLVGWGMVPRGEVGLIFAFVGKAVGVLDDDLFAVIVLMVIGTTLVTPPVLAWLLRPQVAPAAGRLAPVKPFAADQR